MRKIVGSRYLREPCFAVPGTIVRLVPYLRSREPPFEVGSRSGVHVLVAA